MREPARSPTWPPSALSKLSISENMIEAGVGWVKIAASVFRCFVFTEKCYHISIAN